MKPQDTKACQFLFGVELETCIPNSSSIEVGGYHRGVPVLSGISLDGTQLPAPSFGQSRWKSERDGSIRTEPRQSACEFVSPILHGEEGVRALGQFVAWSKQIGASVNPSCGCHITVSVDSIIGSSDNEKRAVFARKLAHIAKWHARAIYGQTGTGRHLNHYSHMLSVEVGALVKRMTKENDVQEKRRAADLCGRGMVNFRKLFSHGVIEFRAFAGTLNWSKLQHHLGTVLGLCRRAHEVQCLGAFEKNKLQASRTQSAVQALEFLWNYLGWNGRNRPVALGLFGELHGNAEMHKSKAMEMCRKFDSAFPEAAL